MPNHPDVEEALSAIGQRDHSTIGEYRIFGPPGTGKATNINPADPARRPSGSARTPCW
jgi:hypothetical protein